MTAGPWVIRIPFEGDWLTSNNASRKTDYQAARVRKWRSTAFGAAVATRPKLPIGLDLIQVDILYRWGVKPVHDLPNMAPTQKVCIDGAIGARRGKAPGYGVVVDDSDRHVRYGSITDELIVLAPNRAALAPHVGEVVLTITDLSLGVAA